MASLDPGTMNKRVELWQRQKLSQTNEAGQEQYQDAKVATFWAQLRPQTGSLLSGRTAGTAISKTTHKVICRYRTGVGADMWLLYGGQRYNIIYVLDPYEKHQTLEMFCEVVTGDG